VVAASCLVRRQPVHSLARKHDVLVMRGARLDLDLLLAPEGVDFDARTEGSLGECDVLLRHNVKAFALEGWMRFYGHFN